MSCDHDLCLKLCSHDWTDKFGFLSFKVLIRRPFFRTLTTDIGVPPTAAPPRSSRSGSGSWKPWSWSRRSWRAPRGTRSRSCRKSINGVTPRTSFSRRATNRHRRHHFRPFRRRKRRRRPTRRPVWTCWSGRRSTRRPRRCRSWATATTTTDSTTTPTTFRMRNSVGSNEWREIQT